MNHSISQSRQSTYEQLADTNILVTGGAGFVGSNLTRSLLSIGVNQIHIVDNLLSSEKINIPTDKRIEFTEGSIADDDILESFEDNYDYIFHLSTYHGNQSSICNPIADYENNQLTTIKLFERVKGFTQLKKLVYSAAGCAVAEKTDGTAYATTEDAAISLQMDSPYSISKIMGEFYSVYYFNQYSLPTVRARFQNVYGPGEILGAGEWRGTPATVWRNVIPTFIYKSLHGESLPIEGTGESSRDFIFIKDIVHGLLLCAIRGEPGGVYNLASGKETSILKLAIMINQLTGNSTPVSYLPARNWDNSGKRYGSTEKAKMKLGFESEISLHEGLNQTILWTKNNIQIINRCIEKHSRYLS